MGQIVKKECDRCGHEEIFRTDNLSAISSKISQKSIQNQWFGTCFDDTLLDQTKMYLCEDCRTELGEMVISLFTPLPPQERKEIIHLRSDRKRIKSFQKAWRLVRESLAGYTMIPNNPSPDVVAKGGYAEKILTEMDYSLKEQAPKDHRDWADLWDQMIAKANMDPIVDDPEISADVAKVIDTLREKMEFHTPQWYREFTEEYKED